MCSLQKKQLRRRIWPAGPPGRLRWVLVFWGFSLAMCLLERNVVVGRGREVGAARAQGFGGARRHELVAAATVAVAAAAEELDALGDDLDGLALYAVLLPLPPVEAAVDRDGPALAQILGAALRLVAEDRDTEEVRLVDPVAGLVAAPAVDGDAEVADGRAAGRVAQFGVARQVADEHDAVDVGCHLALLFFLSGSLFRLLLGGSVLRLLVRRNVRFGLVRGSLVRRSGGRGGRSGSGRVVARRARARAGDVPRGHVAQHGVVDLQHARDLVERRPVGVEDEEVVDARSEEHTSELQSRRD